MLSALVVLTLVVASSNEPDLPLKLTNRQLTTLNQYSPSPIHRYCESIEPRSLPLRSAQAQTPRIGSSAPQSAIEAAATQTREDDTADKMVAINSELNVAFVTFGTAERPKGRARLRPELEAVLSEPLGVASNSNSSCRSFKVKHQ
jgi:hypothetical protein